MSTKWNFSVDIKFCGLILWIYYVILLLFNIVIRLCKNFLFISNTSDYYLTNLYIFSDFIFPVLGAFIIIFVFSSDLSKNSFEYLRSLPINHGNLLLKRFLRLLMFLLVPYALTIINSGFILNDCLIETGETSIELYKYLFITVPVFLFYTAFGLFLTIILRKVFYSSGLCLGFVVEEYISGAVFTKNFRLFINSHQCEYPQSAVINNKIFYFVLSIVLVIVSMVIITVKAKNNK